MKLITERSLILEIADRWREQYGVSEKDPEKHEIQRRLDAIDKATASAADVAKIIGNKSWTDVPDCDECDRPAKVVVEIGAEPDYESSTARVCARCLAKALKLTGNK